MKEYRITEKAGRIVANRNNTGVGTVITLEDDEALAALEAGQIVPAAPEEEAEEAAPEADLDKLTKAELLALAGELSAGADEKQTKAEIIALIVAAKGKAAEA